MTKILGVIQARMFSTRLPRKAMLPILKKPVIWHIHNRLKACMNLDQICVATSVNHADDEIEKFATSEKIPYFRGSEEMVLERLIGAAKKFNSDVIVRITADCPLIDPKIVDTLVSIYQENESDIEFVSNTIDRTFPDGLDTEVIATKFLIKLSDKLRDSFTRSWFSMHIIENHKQYCCQNYKYSKDLSKLRWTLDYKEDYEFIKAVYEELYQESKIFFMKDILSLIAKKPHLSKINEMYPADTSALSYFREKETQI